MDGAVVKHFRHERSAKDLHAECLAPFAESASTSDCHHALPILREKRRCRESRQSAANHCHVDLARMMTHKLSIG